MTKHCHHWYRDGDDCPEHILLLGDSVFDNKTYVGQAPDVVNHLLPLLPKGWTATLCAVDGSTISDIETEIEGIPEDATFLFVSVGGNDALMHVDLLSETTMHGPSMLTELARLAEGFRADYMKAIERVCSLGKKTCLCTIYHGNMAQGIAAPVEAAVAVVNDKIYSVANEKRLTVLDLRRVCNEPGDYANQIEPSDIGGRKIATSVLEHVIENKCPECWNPRKKAQDTAAMLNAAVRSHLDEHKGIRPLSRRLKQVMEQKRTGPLAGVALLKEVEDLTKQLADILQKTHRPVRDSITEEVVNRVETVSRADALAVAETMVSELDWMFRDDWLLDIDFNYYLVERLAGRLRRKYRSLGLHIAGQGFIDRCIWLAKEDCFISSVSGAGGNQRPKRGGG